jgi:transposase-like protein
MPKPKSPFDQLETAPSRKKYIKYFEKKRWKGGIPVSPYDPSAKVYILKDGWYMCSKTRKKFNVKTGTILMHTKLPLRTWHLALCYFSAKKGMSSHELADFLSVTQATAWNMWKDIRSLLKQFNFVKNKLEKEVQIDETLIGGSNPNRHKDKKVPRCQGRSAVDKTLVFGMIQKSGYLIAQEVPNAKMKTLVPIIRDNVKRGSKIYSDELYIYSGLGKYYDHQIVNHSIKEYVRIDVWGNKITTNSIESVWNHFKNPIHGTYHNNISDKYLQNYIDEFTFRFNTRKWKKRDRIDFLISTVVGNNLTYQEFNQLKLY